MSKQRTVIQPTRQRLRIYTLRALGTLLIPIAVFIQPYFAEKVGGVVLYQLGLLLIFACVLGRIWSTLYIGKRKNVELVTDGPYSMVRNPLYFFSALGALGFGLMLQSLIYAFVMMLGVLLIFRWTISHEEAYLQSKFNETWEQYSLRTPCFWPKPSLFSTREQVTWHTDSLKTNFGDAAVFISLIPLVALIEWLRNWIIAFSVPLF